MAIGTAAAIGLGVAGVGSALSARSQSKAASRAADTSLQATRENAALMRDIYSQNKNALSPFMNRGNFASNIYANTLGIGSQEDQRTARNRFENSLGYRYRFDEGMNALNSGYAGAGALQSGDAIKSAIRYGQDYASNEVANYQNGLANLQGVGLGATSALAGVGQNFSQNMAANNTQGANNAANAMLVRGQNNPFANMAGILGGGLMGMGG